jgi:hypothetical protein
MKSTLLFFIACLIVPTIGFAANDYPTQARVEYVLGCMNERGGQTYDNLYGCICSIDKIAAKLPYKDYVEAETFSVMVRTPGEQGGAFRDAPGARKSVKELKKIRETAESSCFVKRPQTTSQ